MSSNLSDAMARIAATTSSFLSGPESQAAGEDQLSALLETKKQLHREHSDLLSREEALRRELNKLTEQDRQDVQTRYYQWIYRGAK